MEHKAFNSLFRAVPSGVPFPDRQQELGYNGYPYRQCSYGYHFPINTSITGSARVKAYEAWSEASFNNTLFP